VAHAVHKRCANGLGDSKDAALERTKMTKSIRAMKVVATTTLPPAIENHLRQRYSFSTTTSRACCDDGFLAEVSGADALIVAPGEKIDRQLIFALPPSVRHLASYSVGLDHVDLTAVTERGISVSNTPDVLTDATADIALMLLLDAVRGASVAQRFLRNKQWHGWQPNQIWGRDLADMTLGILGYGRIGAALEERVLPLGMKVCRYGRTKGNDDAKPITTNLETFLGSCDAISIHVPSTHQTRGMINAGAIGMMRDDVILINTARGDIIDDNAVIDACKTGKIGGIGFDVFANEPNFDPRYLDVPQATLLPHIGSATTQTRQRMGEAVLLNLQSFFDGEDPQGAGPLIHQQKPHIINIGASWTGMDELF
jgi:lactate dehydrogenase-like 2-hydroxyacid dehydrogenase